METIFHVNEKLQIKVSGDSHSSCQFLFNTLKGTAITLPALILYYSTLSDTNQQILTPKRYDEHLRHFYREVPSGIKLTSITFLVDSLNFLCAFLSEGLVATAFASITSGVIPVKSKQYY